MENENLERRTIEFGGTPNISGAGSTLSFGRAGTPRDIPYVDLEDESDLRPNISGVIGPVGFGRAGTPMNVPYIGFQEMGYSN